MLDLTTRNLAGLLGLGVAAWWTATRPPSDHESASERVDSPDGGDRAGVELLSAHFTLNELTTTSTGIANEPDLVIVDALRSFVRDVLEPMRVALGGPIIVTSGFRSPAVNSAVGGVWNSRHLLGRAADIRTPPQFASSISFALWIESSGIPFTFLQSYHPERGGHVHIDYLPSRPERSVFYALATGKSTSDRAAAIGEYADQGRAV